MTVIYLLKLTDCL